MLRKTTALRGEVHRPSATYNRSDLKRCLDELAKKEAVALEFQQSLVALGTERELAVHNHKVAADQLHSKLAECENAQQRLDVRRELNRLNDELDITCRQIDSRIKAMQAEGIPAQAAAAGRAGIEFKLIHTASNELRRDYWFAQKNLEWAEARRTTARRTLAEVKATSQSADSDSEGDRNEALEWWQFELRECEQASTDARLELENLRQELINE